MMVVNYLQLGENRLSKSEIMRLANKDIYYQLKHSGYITETEKGQIKGTPKLHNHISKLDNTHFANSGSKRHSQELRDSLSLLPKSVLERRSFKTSYDIEKDFNKKILKAQEYKETLYQMKQSKQAELETLQRNYQSSIQNCNSDSERYELKLSYQKEKERYEAQLSYLSQKPYLTPDYQVSMTEQEREDYIDNLRAYRDCLEEDSKAYHYYSESISKLEALPTGSITINIEIITNSYQNRELELHRNFELFSNTPQIFLM